MFNSNARSSAEFNANSAGALLNPVNTIWNAWQASAIAIGGNAVLSNASGSVNPNVAAQGLIQSAIEGDAGWYARQRSNAVINNPFGYVCSAVAFHWRVRYAPLLRVYFRTGPSLSNIRILVGYGGNNFLTNTFGTGNVNSGGIRFSTSSADPSWMGVVKNTSGTVVESNLGMLPTINTEYILQIEFSLTEVTYRVKNIGTDQSVRVSVPNIMITGGGFTFPDLAMGGELLFGGVTLDGVAKECSIQRIMQYYRVTETVQE